MPFDYQAHNQRMVAHFLWLEAQEVEYAKYALQAYRAHPTSPNSNILADVKAEKVRRATASGSLQPSSPVPTPAA